MSSSLPSINTKKSYLIHQPKIPKENTFRLTNYLSDESKLVYKLHETYINSKALLLNNLNDTSIESLFRKIDHGYAMLIRKMEENEDTRHSVDKALFLSTGIDGISSTTFSNFRKYKTDLKEKLDILKRNNTEIQQKIFDMKKKSSSQEGNKVDVGFKKNHASSLIPLQIVQAVGNTTLDELFSIEKLREISSQLEHEISIHKNSLGKSKEDYENQLKVLECKGEEREKLVGTYIVKKESYDDMKIKIKNLLDEFQIQSLVQPSFVNTVNEVLDKHGYENHDPYEAYYRDGLLDSYEPTAYTEVNQFINYLQTFEKYFNSKDYYNAVIYAINSPRGVLRTYEIFKRFKQVKTSYCSLENISERDERKSDLKLERNSGDPLLFLCHKLIDTASKKNELSPKLSLEIIKCAVEHSKDDYLVQHWIANESITYSLLLGNFLLSCCSCQNNQKNALSQFNLQSNDTLFDCKSNQQSFRKSSCVCIYTRLALSVYKALDEVDKIIECHIKMGNWANMLEIIHQENYTDMICIFEKQASVQLFYILCKHTTIHITLSTVINIFLQKFMYSDVLYLLKDILKHGLHGVSFMDALLQETYADHVSDEKWYEILRLCEVYEEFDLMEDLFSSLFTRVVLENSTLRCLTDYFR